MRATLLSNIGEPSNETGHHILHSPEPGVQSNLHNANEF